LWGGVNGVGGGTKGHEVKGEKGRVKGKEMP